MSDSGVILDARLSKGLKVLEGFFKIFLIHQILPLFFIG